MSPAACSSPAVPPPVLLQPANSRLGCPPPPLDAPCSTVVRLLIKNTIL